MRVRIFILALVAFSAAGVVRAQDASATVMKWATDNGFAYKSYIQFSKHSGIQVPVPPEVDPPCHVCGDTSKTAGETQVDAWVKQNENPEMQYATELLRMSRELSILKALDQSKLSPAAQRVLTQYDVNDSFNAAKKLILNIYYEKAEPMARQYDKQPKRAYAGIKFLMQASRDAQMIGGSDAEAADNGAVQYSQTWESSLAEKVEQDILSGRKYNMCPVYASIIKSVEQLGGPQTDSARFTETLNKIDKMMHFNVNMDMKLSINPNDGSNMNISWTATGTLYLKVDGANACYTPQLDNGGKMHVQITNFNVVGKNGEVVSLVSPRSYDVPFKTPVVNLCDDQAMMTLPFNAADFQMDTIEAHGHTSKQSFFGAFLSEVATVNNVGSADTNKLSGRTPNPGPAPSGSGSSPDSTTAFNLQAHKNDPGWFMSPEGQKAIADMQKQAMQTTRNAAAAKGVTLPNAGTLTDMMNAISSVRTTWSNGSSTPAQDSFKSNKDSQTLTLNVRVQSQQ